MPSPVTLAQLRVFAAVARHSSFSRAAEELEVSQPYISGQISGLEARLGLVLFNRAGRRAYLSEAGKLFVPYAMRVLDTLREAEQSLRDFRGLVSGHLTIAASSTPGAYLLPRLLGQFLEDYPGVELTLQIKDRLHVEQMVIKQQVELGVVAAQAPSPELLVEVLGLDELKLIVSPNHPWSGRASVELKELERERLIVRDRTSGTRIRIDEELVSADVRPKTRLELSNTDAIKEAVACGLGVAFLSELGIRNELTSRRLVAVPLIGQRLMRTICLVTLNGHKLSPAAAVLRNLILGELIAAERP